MLSPPFPGTEAVKCYLGFDTGGSKLECFDTDQQCCTSSLGIHQVLQCWAIFTLEKVSTIMPVTVTHDSHTCT